MKPYLGVKASERTKNIVSTIQQEQNEIIRSSLFQNRIIQGVAGSGKTTVALHRIAYLAYRYRDLIRNDQYMVIGPNKFFIQYISNMLPELDVDDVKEEGELSLKDSMEESKISKENEKVAEIENLKEQVIESEEKKEMTPPLSNISNESSISAEPLF